MRLILRSESNNAANSERPSGENDENNRKTFDHRSCGGNSAIRRMHGWLLRSERRSLLWGALFLRTKLWRSTFLQLGLLQPGLLSLKPAIDRRALLKRCPLASAGRIENKAATKSAGFFSVDNHAASCGRLVRTEKQPRSMNETQETDMIKPRESVWATPEPTATPTPEATAPISIP